MSTLEIRSGMTIDLQESDPLLSKFKHDEAQTHRIMPSQSVRDLEELEKKLSLDLEHKIFSRVSVQHESDKLINPISPRKDRNRIVESTFNRLKLQPLSKEEKFNKNMKNFSNLQTFVNIKNQLQQLYEGTQNSCIELPQEKENKKGDFPQYLEFAGQYNVSNPKKKLIETTRSRIDVTKYVPNLDKIQEEIYDKLRKKTMDAKIKDGNYLTVFKGIIDYDQKKIRQNSELSEYDQAVRKQTRIREYLNQNRSIDAKVKYKKQQKQFQNAFKEFQSQADKLRIVMHKAQQKFFILKWGNSVMKMKQKNLKDKQKLYLVAQKRGFFKNDKISESRETTPLVSSYPSNLDIVNNLPVVQTTNDANMGFSARKTKYGKDLINEDKETVRKLFEDLDEEEKDCRDQRQSNLEIIKSLEQESSKFHKKYQKQQIDSLKEIDFKTPFRFMYKSQKGSDITMDMFK